MGNQRNLRLTECIIFPSIRDIEFPNNNLYSCTILQYSIIISGGEELETEMPSTKTPIVLSCIYTHYFIFKF